MQRSVLFARTPPEVKLSGAPFLYVTQYRHATRGRVGPFENVRRLTNTNPVPSESIVQVPSTGRCGSTLVSKALAAADDVISLSEPDTYYDLHQLRSQNDPEFEALLKGCTTLLCAPSPAITWAIKFRSMNIELAEPLLRCFPGAKTVFFYRNAERWACSATRAFGLFSSQMLASWDRRDELVSRVRSTVDGPVLGPFHSPIEFLSWTWATSMARAIARYEELSSRPVEVLAALREYCGVHISLESLAAVVAQDAQSGTEHSRARALEPGAELTDERLAAFQCCLADLPPELRADEILPGTYGM